MSRRLVPLLAVCVATTSCVSPESTRTRGGRGADVGNRPPVVQMHEGAQPFWKTPSRIGVEHPPLDPAAQADALSRP